jgi:hypothetical protein
MQIYSTQGDFIDRKVFSYLDFADFLKLSLVCRAGRDFVHREMYFRATLGLDLVIYKIGNKALRHYLHSLHHQNWLAMDVKTAPACALYCFKQKIIGYKEFATTLSFMSVLQAYPHEKIEVITFEDKRFSSIVDETLEIKCKIPFKTGLVVPRKTCLSLQQRSIFYKMVSSKSFSEQCFLAVRHNESSDQENNSLSLGLKKIAFNVLGRANEYIMFPSTTLFQAYLIAQVSSTEGVKEKPTMLIPRLVMSTFAEMYNNVKCRAHDLILASPWVQLPKIIDGFKLDLDPFATVHDGYHSEISNCIPSKFQKAILLTSDLFIELEVKFKEYSELSEWCRLVKEKLIDLDEPTFRREMNLYGKSVGYDEKFWNFFINSLQHVKEAMIENNRMSELLNSMEETNVVQTLWEMMIKKKKTFAAFGIYVEYAAKRFNELQRSFQGKEGCFLS